MTQQNETLLEKLSFDLNFAQVFFAVAMVRTKKEERITTLVRRRFVELMFHKYPPLPLLKEDKERKLIYPSRVNYYKEEDHYNSTLLKNFK